MPPGGSYLRETEVNTSAVGAVASYSHQRQVYNYLFTIHYYLLLYLGGWGSKIILLKKQTKKKGQNFPPYWFSVVYSSSGMYCIMSPT